MHDAVVCQQLLAHLAEGFGTRGGQIGPVLVHNWQQDEKAEGADAVQRRSVAVALRDICITDGLLLSVQRGSVAVALRNVSASQNLFFL